MRRTIPGLVTVLVALLAILLAAPLAAYTVVDLTLARAFGGRWEPFVRVENVFDEEYDEAAGFPAPGTAYTIGVDARF